MSQGSAGSWLLPWLDVRTVTRLDFCVGVLCWGSGEGGRWEEDVFLGSRLEI